MVLWEVDFWPLSETPSFTSSMTLQSHGCEKQQQKGRANEFINPEELEYNSTKLFAKKTQIHRVYHQSLSFVREDRLQANLLYRDASRSDLKKKLQLNNFTLSLSEF